MDLKKLCVELQSLGVRLPDMLPGRRGGAGPAEGGVLIVQGHYLTVPTQSWYVAASPYRLEQKDTAFLLYKGSDAVCDVSLPVRPRYYDVKTASGISLEKVALLHGRDCFASTVYQGCAYWNTDRQCQFCGIGLSLQSGATVLEKNTDDLAFAAEQAHALDGIKHITLTSGAWPDEDSGIRHLLECVKKIKKKTGLPVHAQICPPRSLETIQRLKEAGTDTIGIHIETCSAEILERVAPCKACLGMITYIPCWERAVAVFGKNQVSSFIIAGLGESNEKVIDAAQLLCSLGVFPYLLPLRPIPGTLLETWKPPEPENMFVLYEEVARVLKKHGLSSRQSKAGCVRCGACSSLALFENDR